MHVGGLYCCSGGGYSGRYLNGTLDELRVWTRALSSKEINDKMGVPLLAGDEEGLLFYFPLDEAGMETGANVVESRALPWYAMLGNAMGGGRPTWTVSDAPLSCSRTSRAPICRSLALGGEDTTGFRATVIGGGDIDATEDDDVSLSAVLLLLFLASICSAGLAAVLTYTGIKGELPPIVADASELPRMLAQRVNEVANSGGYTPGTRGQAHFTASASPNMPPARDWKWAQPPRPGQQPGQASGGGGAVASPATSANAAQPTSYGGV